MDNKEIDFHLFVEAEKSKPITNLNLVRNEIEGYLAEGYSMSIIYSYLEKRGYKRSIATMRRWVLRNIGKIEDIRKKSDPNDGTDVTMKPVSRRETFLPTPKLRPKSKTASSTFSQQKASLETKEKEKKLEEQRKKVREYIELSKKQDEERDSWKNYKPQKK